jgi:hypothetical protein
MDATTAAARMLTHSDEFFRYYPVMMAGGTGAFVPNTANVKIYYLGKKGAGNPGPGGAKEGHFGATKPGVFGAKDISSFKMDGAAVANCSGPLTTHGVPMVNYNSDLDGKVNLNANIAAMDHYVVDAGAQYMTTGLLTGCCFAWRVQGIDLWCVHVRPEGIDSVRLQNSMATQGRFAAAPGDPLSTFGRSDYGGQYAIVIGVNTANGWKIYAQTSTDQFRTLTGAWRLFPGAVTRL